MPERYWTISLVAVGAALRCAVWALNPPNNAFDDHLEVVAFVARNWATPDSWACWECYQPPLYYWTAAGVLHAAWWITHSYWISWKVVQALSTAASIAALLATLAVICLAGPTCYRPRIASYAVLALLPTDIFTASFISNDCLVQLFVSLAVYSYVRRSLTNEVRASLLWTTLLAVTVSAACWTKQSGLVATLLLAIAAFDVLASHTGRSQSAHLAMIAGALIVSLTAPVYSFLRSGQWLVSNQQYFDWAASQLPGSLSRTTFSDLRLWRLWKHPFMAGATMGSFWTELFARLWFDYEPKFMSSTGLTRSVGRYAYVCGMVWVAVACLGLWRLLAGRALQTRLPRVILALLALYLTVPLLQTFRFPYFSSMKATFALPGITGLGLLVGAGATVVPHRWSQVLIILVAAQGLSCVSELVGVYLTLPAALAKGPLWTFPLLW